MRCTLALVLALATASAWAQPAATAVEAEAPPAIDGRLDDACWQDGAPIRGFVVLGENTPAQNQTEAWIAYDDENLYVAIKAHDAQMEQVKGTVSDRDGAIFAEDCLELFLDTALDEFHYVQFAVNAIGTRFDAAGDTAGVVPDWNGLWRAKTARAADHWSAEIAIPLATLPLATGSGEAWGLNICRTRTADGELSCWSQTGDAFARPARFGRLGIGADLTPFSVELNTTDWGRGVQGRNDLAVEVRNRGEATRRLLLRLTINPPDEDSRDITLDLGSLAAGEARPASLPYQTFQEGLHALTVAAEDFGGPRHGKTAAVEGRSLDIAASAEFSVAASFYRDHVTIGYDLRVPEATLSRHTVTARLTAADSDAVLDEAWVRKPTAPKGLLRFRTSELPIGQYDVHMALTDPEGKVVAEDVLRFPKLRDDEFGQRLVDVREDNMLIVEGEPFFPIGIYERPQTEAVLEELSQAGFNLCMTAGSPGGAKLVLDKAREYGLHMWLPISHTLDLSSDRENRVEQLAEYARVLGDHPALLCWESIDEPAWGGQDAEGLYDGYCTLRALDQNHPIWMNHAPRNLISTLMYYNRGADIAGADIYPVPEPSNHSNLADKTIAVTGDETDKNREAVYDEKPIFMVLQGFGWKELANSPEARKTAVMPTFEQSRFMAYDAIAHGATGVLYWGTYRTKKPSKFYSELKTLVSELACMHDVLAAPTYMPRRGAPPARAPEGLAVLRKSAGGNTFVIVVNETAEATTARLTIPGIRGEEVRRLFEDTRLPVLAGGLVQVDLEPYGVAVLTDDMDFVDIRKDFSDEWKNAPAAEVAEKLMREPGNAIANPGMEADATKDELPDEWSIRQPFSVRLTRDDVHGGELAMAMVDELGDSNPLVVQSALPIVGEKKYRMTAWAKANPEVETRIYVEWSLAGKWYSGMGQWTRATGEWQQLSTVDFDATPDPQGSAYAVLQMRGKGRAIFDDVALAEVE